MNYKARDVYNLSIDEVWALPEGPMTLEFDDGVIETHNRATIFSYYCAEYIRLFPNTPCLMHTHIGQERLGKKTHLKLVGNCLWDAFEAYNRELDMEELSRIAYEITNRIYNDFTYRLQAYVTSLTVLDFLDVIDHPKVWQANRTVMPTQNSIEHTYSAIKRVLMDPNELVGNPVGKAAKSGAVSLAQILQCVGPRGFLTEIDGTFFRKPILNGYMEGLRSLHDSAIESRSAAKALLYAKDPVAESEYFNRKLQLGTATLSNLYMGDCGTRETIPFTVGADDLEQLEGKYYLTQEGLKSITPKDRHLINKVVLLRSVLKCEHPDPYGFCSTCFGELAYSVPRGTNIGHVSTTVLCEQVSQNILSTKHLDASAKSNDIHLSEHDSRYLRKGADRVEDKEGSGANTLRLSDRLEGQTVQLTMVAHECPMLAGAVTIDDVNKLSPSRVTELTDVQLTVGENPPVTLSVSKGSLKSSLTRDALRYIKEHGWKLTATQDYMVDLSEWDVELPLFELPMKHASMVEYMQSIEKYFKSTKTGKTGKKKKAGPKRSLKDFETAEEALVGFYELVSEKLSVNIAHLETIVASAMVRSERNYDHRLPKPAVAGEVGSYTENMAMRSLSAAMAFEKHVNTLYDVRSFMVTTRPDHPMDELLVPSPLGMQGR